MNQKNVVALSVIVIAGFIFFFWINAAPSIQGAGLIAVPPGSTVAQVTRKLSEDGRIRSTRWFRFLLRVTGADRRLRTGVYRVDEGLSAWGIVRRLSSGNGITIKVTVPEGWTVERIAERMEASGVCLRADFLAAASSVVAEGFLFPDTYEFSPYASAEKVRDAMMSRFDSAWRTALSDFPPSGVEISSSSTRQDRVKIGGRWWTAGEVVALASIIEREGGPPHEKPLIAAVYQNRLKKGMRLEADPTVQYALGRWKERLLYKDLEVDSPYNTYRRFGLPPGPIGNPGLDSIRATLSPADAPYLYFVADAEGGHLFSVTYAEHLKKVRSYRRLLQEKKRASR